MRIVVAVLAGAALLLLAGCMQAGRQPQVTRAQADAYLKTVDTVRDRSIVLVYEGKAEEGIRDIAAVLEQGRNTFGRDSGFAARALWAKGVVLREARRHDEAERDLQEALRLLEGLAGREAPIVGSVLSGLALTYQQAGRYPEAEPLRRRALEIAEKDKGAGSDLAGARWGEMAEALLGLGRYVEAEEAQQKSLDILEKAGRTEWIAYLLGLNRLAEIYRTLDRREDMEAPLRKAVNITASGLPQASVFALRSRHALGVYLLEQDRVGEAEACLREGLDAAAAQKSSPTSHALLLLAMAEVKDRQGASAAAAELRKQAGEMTGQGKTS